MGKTYGRDSRLRSGGSINPVKSNEITQEYRSIAAREIEMHGIDDALIIASSARSSAAISILRMQWKQYSAHERNIAKSKYDHFCEIEKAIIGLALCSSSLKNNT
jgi:hypothetical protein